MQFRPVGDSTFYLDREHAGVDRVTRAPFLNPLLLYLIHQQVLRWIFVGFLLLVAARVFFLVPDRSVALDFTPWLIVGLLVLGLVTGTVSGMLGVGGGVFIVPALMLLFGIRDLVAKGTSLLMIIPTAVTGTIANVRSVLHATRSRPKLGVWT